MSYEEPPSQFRTASLVPGLISKPRHRPSLREREDLHRLACEAGRTGSWYVRLDTQECVLSPMAAILFGLPAEATSLPAGQWRERVDAGDLENLEKAVIAAIQSNAPFEFEFAATRTDGTEYWLYVRGEILRDENGFPVRVHGAVVDLTEQQRAKRELKRLNETLEQRVAERTAELVRAQEALRQSQKLEAMGQLTGGIAHDFNNLLTPIIGNLDLLLQGEIPSERRKSLVAGALKSAELAQTLVQRLLAFARRQPLHTERVDIAAAIAGMADIVGRTSGPQIRLEIDVADDLAPARADPNQLQVAILNLCVNARDAMPDGGTLSLSVSNELAAAGHRACISPGPYLRLVVADTGIGMDEATRVRAIEPFFSTKEVGAGTGLGLSMVHGLASQMGGALTLSSEPGVGTVAELWIPVWDGPAEGLDVAPSAGQERSATGRVLLVDDHALVRESTAEMLASLGYEVVQAGSGEQAAEILEKGLAPALIVSDHLMAGMSGVDLAGIVRSRWPATPFLIISGYSDPGRLPPDLPCLMKPFRRAELEARIRDLKPDAAARPALRSSPGP